MNDPQIYLPINQGEQAKQKNRNTLLARDVFQKIASLLKSSLDKVEASAPDSLDDLDEHRAHEAILIDGGRGTGKSSVLVNLQMYMDEEEGLKNKLLILKPVDPTLLENGDDLFLNIIVAALIRDKQIKNSLNKGDRKSEAFYEQLQKLGNALEGVQTQREKHGLDKLRAFIGNHSIADEVHQLFKCAIDLTGKKLIVLPIDDVDTSLQHAFENMEVVRKYLASPFVVPIISGDLDLYHDVTWRDFYGRIIKDHEIELNEAKICSQSLANEYQRKVLPISKRIKTPSIGEYLKSEHIFLADGSVDLFSLNFFKDWLVFLVNGHVGSGNGVFLNFPIRSIRELSQLIFHSHEIIHEVKCFVVSEKSSVDANDKKEKIQYEDIFFTKRELIRSWWNKLESHCFSNKEAGAVYLALSANLTWSEDKKANEIRGVFSPDLFNPNSHSLDKYKFFDINYALGECWQTDKFDVLLEGEADKKKMMRSILPYPDLEVSEFHRIIDGYIDNLVLPLKLRKSNHLSRLEFVKRLVCHDNYMGGNLTSISTGRIVELIVHSFIYDITPQDIYSLLERPPFFSDRPISHSKVDGFNNSFDRDVGFFYSEKGGKNAVNNNIHVEFDHFLLDFSSRINKWRAKHELNKKQKPHALFIYKVIGEYFKDLKNEYGEVEVDSKYVVGKSIESFQNFWVACGSVEMGFFEKKYIGNYSVFDDSFSGDFKGSAAYRMNILPFFNERFIFEMSVSSRPTNFSISLWNLYTNKIGDHPLYPLLNELLSELEEVTNIGSLNWMASNAFKKVYGGIPSDDSLADEFKEHPETSEKVISIFEEMTGIPTSHLISLDSLNFNAHGKSVAPELRKMFMLYHLSLGKQQGRKG